MKNRLFLQFSLLALVAGAFVINGCKDTVTDPGYTPLAEIRFADFHQVQPIQIYMYPQTATSADSGSKTPTPMTYGIVTPYFNNLPTNRSSGEIYHLVAIKAGSKTQATPQGVIVASTDITLMPGDKKTWLITGNDGVYDPTIIDDNHPTTNDTTHAFFRFLNVSPTSDFPGGLTLMVGDPINGIVLAKAQPYKTVSAYQPIPLEFVGNSAVDTSVTFYVVNPANGVVISRLAGWGLEAGSYHTLTWGGATVRIPDPTTGNLTLNDTARIRVLDDDQLGTDLTPTPPLTFRFNIINALLPPSHAGPLLIDYTATGGLNIVINNNTSYDYKGVIPFQPLPYWGNITGDGVFNSVPTTVPLVDKIYIKMVKPFAGAKNPSVLDSVLFQFYAGSPRSSIVSDQIYSVVVFDTVKKNNPKASAPFDSAAGTLTIPIPDVPIPGSAKIVLGNMLAPAKAGNTPNIGVFTIDADTITKVKAPKSFDATIVKPAGQAITLKASVNKNANVYTFTFTPQDGAIYEALLVGKQDHPNSAYQPRFMVIRVNPK